MIYEIPVPNIDDIIDHVKKFDTFYPWNDNEPNYYGHGLTYDPSYPIDKFKQVLGPVSGLLEEYQQSERFCHYTSDKSEKLFELINLPYNPIRSRIAIIDGSHGINSRSAWHVDEPLNQCIRVNIPIMTNEYYHLQTEDCHITPKIGYAYIWDTSKIHRAYCSKPNDLKRMNLVLGYIPDSSDSWISDIVKSLVKF